MWIFYSPKDYSEMVEKISKCVFVITALLLFFVSCISSTFRAFIEKISFNAKAKIFDVELNLALFYIPIIAGILEHMFKIHDLVSNLLNIRKTYDRKIIVASILKKINKEDKEKELDDSKVYQIMEDCFYKYASSTKPQIDQHSIILALNEWCWFWILLDTLIVSFIVGLFFSVSSQSWKALLLTIALLDIICLFMIGVETKMEKYTYAEVNEIFKIEGAKEAIETKVKKVLG